MREFPPYFDKIFGKLLAGFDEISQNEDMYFGNCIVVGSAVSGKLDVRDEVGEVNIDFKALIDALFPW